MTFDEWWGGGAWQQGYTAKMIAELAWNDAKIWDTALSSENAGTFTTAEADEVQTIRAELAAWKDRASREARIVAANAERIDQMEAELAACQEALSDMVNQFFIERENGTISHSFMSAEEHAIAYLLKAGLAEEVSRCRYRLIDAARKGEGE
jgi:hypothetical protein